MFWNRPRNPKKAVAKGTKAPRSKSMPLSLEKLEARDLMASNLSFAFGQTGSIPPSGYTEVTNKTLFNSSTGFGWQSGTVSADSGANITANGDFAANLADGEYQVAVTLGDPRAAHTDMQATVQGAQQATVSTAAGATETTYSTVNVTNGRLELLLKSLGGTSPTVGIERVVAYLMPTATFSAPASVNAGSTNATVTFSNPSGGSGGYTYSYYINNNPIIGSNGSRMIIPENYIDNGPSTFVVQGKITDSTGHSTSYIDSIKVNDVPPTATLSNNGAVNIGSPVTVSFSNASDPSHADTTAGFHYSFALNRSGMANSYAKAGTASSANFTFTKAGTYTVYGVIFDDHNGFTDYTTTVTVNGVATPTSDVTITETADHAAISADSAAGYTITLTNTGTVAASGVTLSDALPAGLGKDITWSIDTTTGNPSGFILSGAVGSQTLSLPANTSLAAGASLTVHITGLTSTADVGTLTNTATVNATNEPTADQNQKASASVTVNASDVTITETADHATISADSAAGYTITLTNTGTVAASGVTLSDSLPAGLGKDITWAVDTTTGNPSAFVLSGAVGSQTLSLPANTSLAAGASLTVHITGLTTTADVGTLSNTATVNAINEPTADQNQQASASITVSASDVTVAETADQATISAGNAAGFTITLTNTGAVAASGVTLSDALPAGLGKDITWSIDTTTGNPSGFILSGAVGSQTLSLPANTSLAAGASLTVHITGLTSTADVGTLTNTATVNAINEPTADQNQKASASVTVSGSASDVTITETADQTSISAEPRLATRSL